MISIHMYDCVHNYRTKVLHAHADIPHFILEKTVECIDLTIIILLYIYRFGFCILTPTISNLIAKAYR